jgi:hypothetical protein
MAKPEAEEQYRQELLLSRRVLKEEMRKAINTFSPDGKKRLAASWKERYSPDMAKELLRVARDYEARDRIANWNLEGFETDRRKSRK